MILLKIFAVIALFFLSASLQVGIQQLQKIKIMKNVIEQIKKIEGVKTVEMAGEGMAVVVFEGVKAKPKFMTDDGKLLDIGDSCWFTKPGFFDTPLMVKVTEDMPDSGSYFSIKHYKSQSLQPEDLVDGEIYFDLDPSYLNIFRYKKPNFGEYASYSRLFLDDNHFELEQLSIAPKGIRPTTIEEKLRLIGEELKNGYNHINKQK